MARRSQCSSEGDNPLNPNYLPPHYREEYRLAIDALVEEDLEGYYQFLQRADVVDFLSRPEIEYIQGTVQAPQQETNQQPEVRYLDCEGEGSSDTYWPVHSDLEAPGLDLGWPDEYRFIGPTEVTTLVNPAEPNMPSIKEQARRLIKNAQQVIAVVMDMFTDVDIFADILGAAMRNVAVYILLDEQNAHHFINMAMSCRVNLESIQFLRVRTVSGITYRYRSGKTLKGQMMDRFLLTDCRAVLSGNYSFMWSFEKLHRCLAHLFLGHLVTTFDEEFRILFAQSQPLIIENVLPQMEDLSHVSDKQYSGDRTQMYRDIRKGPPMDISQPEDWARYPYDERTDMDWKKMPLGRQESIQRSREQGPGAMYNRYPSQQSSTEQPYEQGHSRMPINLMETAGLKRHSYAEGLHDRPSPYQFMQQPGMPNIETQGRQFQREQKAYPRAGPETGYSGYDRLWGQGYHPVDQYPPEPGFPDEIGPLDSYDPVANYLSSTSNVELDQGSDKLLPPGEVPFGLPHPKRQNIGQPYACQSSPTAPIPPDQKQFFQEPNMNRKDPSVKQGLRDWRISSYLSAFDDTEDEDPPMQPAIAPDPLEEPPKPFRRSSVPELSVLKIPNTREFKIPAVPRVSQLPNYMKHTVPEHPKNVPDYCIPVAAETKTTPTTPTTVSESSSTTEGDKAEEVELKEPKDPVVRRDESFRRKYNAAMQRSSRLRSSLIFSSQVEQHDSDELKIASGQPDEETVKTEEPSELPYASKVLSQRRPYEWSRYLRSSTFDNATTEASKADNAADKTDIKDLPKEETSKDLLGNKDIKEPSKSAEIELSHSVPAPNPSQVQPPDPFLDNQCYLDMNDPDQRLMFFKQLAAKQKAAKAAAAEKSTEEALPKPPSKSKHITVKKEEPAHDEVSHNLADSFIKKPATTAETFSEKKTPPDGQSNTSTETHGTVSLHLDVKDDTDSEKTERKNSQQPIQPPEQLPLESSISSPIKLSESHGAASPLGSESSYPLSIPPLSISSQNIQSEFSSQVTVTEASSENIPPKSSSSQNIPSESNSAPHSTQLEPVSSPSDSTRTPPSITLQYSPPPSPHQMVMSPKSDKTGPNKSICPSLTESPQASIQASPQPSISSGPCANDSEPNTASFKSSTKTDNEESHTPKSGADESLSSPKFTEPGSKSITNAVSVESRSSYDSVLSDPKDVKNELYVPPSRSNLSLDSLQHNKSCSRTVSDVESSILSQRPDETELLTSPNLPSSESSPEPAPTETSLVPSPAPSESSSSSSSASSRLKLTPTSSLSEHAQTGSNSPSLPTAVVCHSPGSVPDGSIVSPQLETTETITPSDPSQSETSSGPDLGCKTPTESESSALPGHPSEPPIHVENNNVDDKCEESEEPEGTDSVSEEKADAGKKTDAGAADTVNKTAPQESAHRGKPSEKAKENNSTETTESTSAEVIPLSPQPKQTKANRYHSSTASVLASSNLRDDTKLLLEQISANSQSRAEPTKALSVTDDEKEDDKSVSREKRGGRSLGKGLSKTPQEREKLLEKIQSMRKERKVYSRFDMGH